LDVSSAPGWNASGPVEVLELSPPVEVDRRTALVEATVQQGVSSNPAKTLTDSFEAPAVRLTRLEDALLETRMCVAMSQRFGFVRESVRQGRRKLERAGYVVHETGELTFPERETVSVDFPAIHVALPYEQHNYFHWTFEALAGLLIAGEHLPRDARVVVRLEPARYEAETLASLGIAPESVLVLPPERVVQFPELYVLPRPFDKSAPAPIVADVLRGLVPDQATEAPSRRLYVARSSRRRIVNEEELRATLERHGFSEVSAEGLSVSEQIALFAQAEAVIGVHGAGLANSVYSPPGALLIELQPERREGLQLLYWNVAAICGLRYIRIVCKSLTRRLHSDLEVDCSHLDAVLRRWLSADGFDRRLEQRTARP
jgi:capsular polysaccharide biosynthesis protein